MSDGLPSLREDAKEETEQETRSRQRIDFLRALKKLSGETCDVTLCTGFASPSSKFGACDRDLHHAVVEDFSTPTGNTLPAAKLRLLDVQKVEFKKA